jgi:hypothetical protein
MSEKEIIHKECEGCISSILIKDECYLYCLYGMASFPCPCKSCLIKSICLDSCDEFDETYKLHEGKTIIKRNMPPYERNK